MNHSYSSDFLPTRVALAFAVIDVGLIPVAADADIDSGTLRLTKLFALITSCQHSIHDLTAPPVDNLPRNNMPLELGADLVLRHLFTDHYLAEKRYLILVANRDAYFRSLSDLAGLDPVAYGQDTEAALGTAIEFLRPVSPRQRTEDQVRARHLAFLADAPNALSAVGHLPGSMPSLLEHRPSAYFARMLTAMRHWEATSDTAPDRRTGRRGGKYRIMALR